MEPRPTGESGLRPHLSREEEALSSPMKSAEYDVMARAETDYWWYRGLRALVAVAIRRFGTREGAMDIVDAGCGTGGTYLALSRKLRIRAYVGVDLEPMALAHCRERGMTQLIRGDIARLPLLDRTADAVIALDTLYFESIDPAAALRRFYEILRPGGLVVVNIPAFPILRGEHDLATGVYRRFRKRELVRLVEAAGLEPLRATYWNFLMFFPLLVWRKLSLSRRPDKGHQEPRSDLVRLPDWINEALSAWIHFEVWLSGWTPLPLGSSVFVVARRQD